jgi:hypothetical protein
VEPLRSASPESTNLEQLKDQIISLFYEIADISFKSVEKNKDKTQDQQLLQKF